MPDLPPPQFFSFGGGGRRDSFNAILNISKLSGGKGGELVMCFPQALEPVRMLLKPLYLKIPSFSSSRSARLPAKVPNVETSL